MDNHFRKIKQKTEKELIIMLTELKTKLTKVTVD